MEDTDLDPPRDGDTVLVVVGYDTPPGRFTPQPVVREVPRRLRADWDDPGIGVRATRGLRPRLPRS